MKINGKLVEFYSNLNEKYEKNILGQDGPQKWQNSSLTLGF